ncbi:YraN family protein [Bariatricus massiliensis]|uniref:UPF0102 protein LIZ65_02255 n=1 Tax=Bariatricus massiliensis TaxID=1745713 RepID=A0ABS8DCF2_9FIRM|nr:YraN family protein [Bariatricus massiliensis]MCB7303296.1 YraN family protein [Bariatricus massiliensis]MCB7373428.1 YraN family protein [Bariatricus massiliensis]MCB7386098.1 YraN family protein [Bariatricus massiliensis]MCB7410260.1 YraN family protein [Bariatricus massiliensis]MCQ5252456.1 YraN family protein [Bariatricus massiliensis]
MKKEIIKKNKCANVNKRRMGTSFERLAGQFLEMKGYQIRTYNYYCRYAEIDIVAEESGYLVFCEVKYRCKASAAETLAAVDVRKQRQICRGALFYMYEHHITGVPCRFDVVGITGGDSGHQITLVKDAFDYK